jgi:3',5'-cyclic AMP phosphodiesterase CpdA
LRLLAVSDVHVRQPDNRAFIEGLGGRGEHEADWLILAGDLGESEDDLDFVLGVLAPRFARLVWVPGNHELWTLPPSSTRGARRYEALCDVCRRHGAACPEDPYPRWPGPGPDTVVAPLFLLYDYSFAPDGMAPDAAVAWAAEADVVCSDEVVLHPDPYPSRQAWCEARLRATEARLDALGPGVQTVLVNHFPLRREHAVLPAVPRFTPWCGTRRTEDWHVRFRARAVVFGHLHIRGRRVADGVPFHEVSLGYRGQWNPRTPERYVHTILSTDEREP